MVLHRPVELAGHLVRHALSVWSRDGGYASQLLIAGNQAGSVRQRAFHAIEIHPVLGIKRRLRNRSRASAMAAVAGQLLGSLEVACVQVADHPDHLAGLDLLGLYVGFVWGLVAMLAIHPQGIGEE